ncbi:50S ribosomal protein L23 [Acidianus manzaensis]|uniref:Large ribosomal subunit protein uL23 n=1 Tax=Acidianus manzaensis TaxID=282676 RepID=A0A1W6K085_9CREN|nr:50S ribosomal protein L23 [Acidianus manzaensis]ARM75928.1 50S ribosomal protein L23 [Acidianus manzaensis]
MKYVKEVLSTEKATKLIENSNTLTFILDRNSDKKSIKSEIENTFNVKVEKVNIVITPTGEKKAYVKIASEYKATDVAHKLGIL